MPKIKLSKQVKRNLIFVAKYTSFLLTIAVLWHARINPIISPFALGFLFATVYLPINPWFAAGSAFVLSLTVEFSHSVVLGNLFAVLVFCTFAVLFQKRGKALIKKRRDFIVAIAFYIFAQVFFIGDHVRVSGVDVELFQELISTLIGSVFLFSLIILFKTARERRGKIPWTIDQKICLCIFVVVFALGLGGLESDYFSIHKFATVLAILVGVYWFNSKNALIVAICMGLGRSFLALNLNFVAIYATLALVVVGFKSRRPYMSIVALIITDIVLGTYFDAYVVFNVFTLIPLILAIGVFLVLPRSLPSILDVNLHSLNTSLVSKNTINQNRNQIWGRLKNLSSVFTEMGGIYKRTVRGELPHAENAKLIANQVIINLFERGPTREALKLSQPDTEAVKRAIHQMVEVGLHRGQITFLDVPPVLNMKHVPLGPLMNEINALITHSGLKKSRDKTLDSGKILMAQLLEGVGSLCDRFAGEVSGQVVFDNDRAEQIKEDLLCRSIVVADALITRTGVNEVNVSILISRTDVDKKNDIQQIISKICGHSMIIDTIQSATTAGFSIVTLKTAPRFNLVYGVSQIAKGYAPLCGDTYTVLRANSERTIVAISDGMGAGEEAHRTSTLSLSLIENFYKAGFPSEVILSSVNQLLTITGGEVFSALDIAVFNLVVGEVTFIKLGAVEGFLKHERETELIESGSLPLGVLDEMKPKIASSILTSGDYVILISDGILDAFAGDRLGLGSFINNLNPKSAQDLADEIMNEALNRTGRTVNDDSTVLVVQVHAHLNLRHAK